MTDYTICNNIVSDKTIEKYQAAINSVFEGAKAAAAANGGELDIKNIIDASKQQLSTIDNSMAAARKIVNDCINNFKQKTNEPDTTYDKNTSYLMLENSQLLHQEIIYNRIQILFYITALLYFFYRMHTVKNN